MIKKIVYGALGFSVSALLIANLLTSMPDTYVAASQQNASEQETPPDESTYGMEPERDSYQMEDSEDSKNSSESLLSTYHVTTENLSGLEEADVVNYGRVNPMLFWEKASEPKAEESAKTEEADPLDLSANKEATSDVGQVASITSDELKAMFTKYGVLPVKEAFYGISSAYGPRVDPFDGTPDAFHSGLDIASAGIAGGNVYNMFPGVVSLVGSNPDGYGNYIVIDHGEFTTLYGHLKDAPNRKEGDVLLAGDEIGLVGSTGRSTGPHLHVEIDIAGVKADPEPLMAVVGETGNRNKPKELLTETSPQ